MKLQEIVAIADPFIDEKGLAKALAAKIIVPVLKKYKEQIESKEIDPLKFTELENIAIAKFLADEIAKLEA